MHNHLCNIKQCLGLVGQYSERVEVLCERGRIIFPLEELVPCNKMQYGYKGVQEHRNTVEYGKDSLSIDGYILTLIDSYNMLFI